MKTRQLLYTSMWLVSSISASAQCLTNSLVVNTGYTPTGPIATGAPDPNWQVVALSADITALSIAPTPPFSAIGVNTVGSWTSNPNSKWISFYNPSPWYVTTPVPDEYSMTLRRTFTMCQDDQVRITLTFSRDNWMKYLKVDGTTLFSETANNTLANFQAFYPTTPPVYTVMLTAGTHTIETEVVNFHETANPNQNNPHGFNLVGTVTSVGGNNSIIDDNGCPGYVCDDDCSDECFWRVSGNNILSNKNFFGTRTKDDVRVITNNTPRGILSQQGLLGWNTMLPTAFMHVNCTGNNPDDGSAGTSDVRFENLEPGDGDILVINQAGYVFRRRGVEDPDDPKDGTQLRKLYEEEKAKTEQMQTRLDQLEMQVKKLTALLETKAAITPVADGNTLGQNAPNPFGKETAIEYNVQSMERSASIDIYDVNGKKLARYPITAKGKGALTVESEKLIPGMYMYSLVIDGREVATKRMIFSK